MTKSFVDITAKEQIATTSKGMVTTRWNPSEGASRKQQIEEARLQAHEDYLKQLKEAEPYTKRLLDLEQAVAKLQAELKLLGK